MIIHKCTESLFYVFLMPIWVRCDNMRMSVKTWQTHKTLGTRHSRPNTWLPTPDTPPWTIDTCHTVVSLHTALGRQHTSYDTGHLTFDNQNTTLGTPHSTLDTRHSKFICFLLSLVITYILGDSSFFVCNKNV